MPHLRYRKNFANFTYLKISIDAKYNRKKWDRKDTAVRNTYGL